MRGQSARPSTVMRGGKGQGEQRFYARADVRSGMQGARFIGTDVGLPGAEQERNLTLGHAKPFALLAK